MKYDYDLVVIGTPVWAGKITPAIRTFIAKNKNALKKVAFVATASGKDYERAFKELEFVIGIKPEFKIGATEKDLKDGSYKHQIEKLNLSLN